MQRPKSVLPHSHFLGLLVVLLPLMLTSTSSESAQPHLHSDPPTYFINISFFFKNIPRSHKNYLWKRAYGN